MKRSGAEAASPTAPTRSRRCRRRLPAPGLRPSPCRGNRSLRERTARGLARRGHSRAATAATSRRRDMLCKSRRGPAILAGARRQREAPGRMRMPKLHASLLTAWGLLLALSTAVAAQDSPTKPVRLIIPFPPGGSNDVVGRLIATHLSERLGKQVVVDNRGAGAGGVVGSEVAANAPRDGYTLLIISLAHAVNPWLYKLPYDPIKAFTPIAILASGPNVLVVNPELPVHSVAELLAAAKDKPGQLQYASAGVGSFQHLGGELFKLMAGVNILHVPFKGGGPAM